MNDSKTPLELTGTIIEIFDTRQITADFCLREFVIETEGKYKQQVKLQVINEKCHEFHKYNKVGNRVNVLFDVRGRKSDTGQYWNSLVAYYIEVLDKPVNGHDVEQSEDLPF